MIYCVRFSDVETHLVRLGYRRAGATEQNVLFISDTSLVTIRMPNVQGHVPELLVNEAFDVAEVEPPKWDVFWCD